MKIEQAINELKKNAGKRNFAQSYDLFFLLQNIDVRKPDQRIKLKVTLPYPPFKQARTFAIITKSTTNLGKTAQKQGIDIIEPIYLEEIAQNKKKAKRLAEKYDAFLCDVANVKIMARALGPILGPKNKMPLMVPGSETNLDKYVDKINKTVSLSTGMQKQLQTLFGNEKMPVSQLVENFNTLLSSVLAKLPKGRAQLRKVLIKPTMGKPIVVEV